ncbi:arylamine N-acetyltransferase [Cyanobacteria bacterium FACHB-471]|nr:arylamine N-acetyltransferase [Cyanobacteria bacterium FACHB-471]
MKQTSDVIDLNAYFQRIGYSGDRSPTLTTLQAIHLCHAKAIAFENLNPLLKQPVLLDLESLQRKLVYERRGGYCFEQNLLLRSVLLTLDFQVTNLAARVIWGLPKGSIMPRTHMLLRIDLDGEPYVADVGFGGLTLTTPLSLKPDFQQSTPHELFRLIGEDSTYIMQVFTGQEWKSLYRFDLHEQQLPDYEVSNWYISTHPNSPFVNSLIAARPDSDRRYALRNNQLAIHHLDNPTERKTLSTATELRSALEDLFQLELGAIANLDTVLQRLIDNPLNA